MASLKVQTKNKVEIDKKPRVYFTCHPEDFEKHFKKVCDDIFASHDCAIYYTEDMTATIAEDEKDVDLGRNNLFVIPVTHKLLSEPSRAMDGDIPYALKEHIPILPIMTETGIDECYSKSDKLGQLQYLNPYSTDLTEIPYKEKLKKYLEAVLISDELAQRVRAAFDARIFLSYRKKDRKYANKLMRLIHSNPECRDIAIWFDEFLTPGESFKENIEKILEDCKLFTLLVTPHLLEKVVDQNGKERDNYVISTELPLALKNKAEKGTNIFAVEMKKTDKDALSAISIEDYTNPKDKDFRARLIETVSAIALTTNNTPEHQFLIGLAYLEGIDVEVDRERGIMLIQAAAEKKLPEAIYKLVELYENGIGLPHSIDHAIMWQNRLIGILESKYKKTHHKNDLVSLFWARYHCAELYIAIKEYRFAENKINKILPQLLACRSQNKPLVNMRWDICNCILLAFLILSDISLKKGELSECEYHLEKAQAFYTNIAFANDQEDSDMINIIITNYVAMYLQLARLSKEQHIYDKSFQYAERALRNIGLYLPETSAFYDRRTETIANELAGDSCFYRGDFEKAESYYAKMYDLSCINASAIDNTLYQRDLAYSCNRMGEIMLQSQRLKEAKKYFLKSLKISQNIENPNDEDEENIAFCYNRFGDISWQKNRPLVRAVYYRKAFLIRLRLFKKSNNLDSIRHLAYSYVNLGRTSLFRRKHYFAEAKKLFEILIAQSQIPDFYREEMRMLLKN